MKWTVLLFVSYFLTIQALPLPADLLPSINLDDYTVLYKGPAGSHYQSGEPGKFVKGVYTFLDSNGRKQQVTYEADARGYRVKTSGSGAVIDSPQELSLKSALQSSRFETGDNGSKGREDERLKEEGPKSKESEIVIIQEELDLTNNAASSDLRDIVRKTLSNSRHDESSETDKTVSHAGLIKFKESRSLQQSEVSSYFLGYPFVPGNYVYAL